MALTHWQSVSEILAGHLLNSVVEGLAIALLVSLILRMLDKQNSSTRFAMLLSALAAVVAMPVVESLAGRFVESFRPSTGPAYPAEHSALSLPGFWAVGIVIVWAMIATAALARIAAGFWLLQKLRRSCVPVDWPALPPALRQTLQQFGTSRALTLCVSDQVRVPTAIGFFRPAIVIPSWALSELTPTELNAVVLHEVAHLRRWDDWTNLAQQIVRAILFFHPAVWWIGGAWPGAGDGL